MDILRITCTALLSVAILFIVAKFMGHKQVSQLDFFDYINGITIGSIVAELATELEEPIKPLIATLIYGMISVVLSFVTNKFPRTRKFINGTPTILLSNGKIYRDNLRKSKLDLSEFMLLCREAGYFDLRDIQVAVFEQNGKLSVLPKSSAKPLTPSDVNIETKPCDFGTEVIMDGRILGENLARMGKDTVWLKRKLAANGYNKIDNVFLGVFFEAEDSIVVFPKK